MPCPSAPRKGDIVLAAFGVHTREAVLLAWLSNVWKTQHPMPMHEVWLDSRIKQAMRIDGLRDDDLVRELYEDDRFRPLSRCLQRLHRLWHAVGARERVELMSHMPQDIRLACVEELAAWLAPLEFAKEYHGKKRHPECLLRDIPEARSVSPTEHQHSKTLVHRMSIA